MKKKILIHSIVFSPDGVSTAYLYNDIALKFKENGYDVVVLTTTPHYNVVDAQLLEQPLLSKLRGLYYQSDFKGIKVIHVPQKKFRSSILRMIGFVYWHFLSLILGLFQKNISIILSPSPPLTIGFINLIIGKLKGAKVIYNVQEIYPDFLINQGGLKFRPIISVLKSLESIVYNKSNAVTTIDNVFYNTIADRFNDVNKLHIIPNFVDTTLFKPVNLSEITLDPILFPKDDSLKIMYAGNIGHAQDWEPLLEVAKRIKDLNVDFWVIGEGAMKAYLMEQIQLHHLDNIHLISYQPRKDMPTLLAYADLHFIFMTPEMEGQGFPSKVYTIMACSKPLMVISGQNTPINNFLKPLHCSFIIEHTTLTDKCEAIISNIKECLTDRTVLDKLGQNGFDVIEKKYSKGVVSQKYVELSNQILNI